MRGVVRMNNYDLIYNYRDNDKYRQGFGRLAKAIYGIDFENWYQRGFWNDRYICYSMADDDKVVANVSVNKMDIIWNGLPRKALQIGSVMTDQEYRGQGLAAKLMDIVLKEYEPKYDFLYLYANENVLEFYPKFGFISIDEYMSKTTLKLKSSVDRLRKLDISNNDDVEIITRIHAKRVPISQVAAVLNDQHILMHYLLSIHNSNVYLVNDNIIVIMKHDGYKLHLYDVICTDFTCYDNVLHRLGLNGTIDVHFYFTPDLLMPNGKLEVAKSTENLFVKPRIENERQEFMLPSISQA